MGRGRAVLSMRDWVRGRWRRGGERKESVWDENGAAGARGARRARCSRAEVMGARSRRRRWGPGAERAGGFVMSSRSEALFHRVIGALVRLIEPGRGADSRVFRRLCAPAIRAPSVAVPPRAAVRPPAERHDGVRVRLRSVRCDKGPQASRFLPSCRGRARRGERSRRPDERSRNSGARSESGRRS